MTDAVITAEPGTQNITITREFDATPEQLFRAHTDSELFVQWVLRSAGHVTPSA